MRDNKSFFKKFCYLLYKDLKNTKKPILNFLNTVHDYLHKNYIIIYVKIFLIAILIVFISAILENKSFIIPSIYNMIFLVVLFTFTNYKVYIFDKIKLYSISFFTLYSAAYYIESQSIQYKITKLGTNNSGIIDLLNKNISEMKGVPDILLELIAIVGCFIVFVVLVHIIDDCFSKYKVNKYKTLKADSNNV